MLKDQLASTFAPLSFHTRSVTSRFQPSSAMLLPLLLTIALTPVSANKGQYCTKDKIPTLGSACGIYGVCPLLSSLLFSILTLTLQGLSR